MSLRQPSQSKRFSREGFKRIPNDNNNMAPNDATIDIPLEQVPSSGQGLRVHSSATGLQPSDTYTSQTHKRSLFRGRRAKPEAGAYKTGKVGYDGEEDTINTMGKIYKKVMNFSVFTRYLFYVIPLAAIIAIPIVIGALDTPPYTKIGGVRILWFFTWVEMVWLSLWGAKTIARTYKVYGSLI